MLGNVSLVVLTIALLQLMLAVGWSLGLWALELPRRPARHWAASALLGAAALGLVLAREGMGEALMLQVGVPLSNLLMLATAAAMVRGLRLFLGRGPGDGELVMVLAASVIGSTAAALSAGVAELNPPVWLTSGGLVWLFGRGAVSAVGVLRREFSARAALMLSLPMALLCLVGLLRIVSAAAGASRPQPLHIDQPVHVGVALLLMLAVLSMHGAVLAMVAMRLVARLHLLSTRDALTGLYNRSEWMEQLALRHQRLVRRGEVYAVLLLDVDHFKQVNDRWGHPAGDAVLAGVAERLAATVRRSDSVGRLGGEEFGVLLEASGEAGACLTAERLRQAVAEARVAWQGAQLGVSISIGVAVVDRPGEPIQHVLERADRALYAAKAAGRDRVVVAGSAGGEREGLDDVRETQPAPAGALSGASCSPAAPDPAIA